MSLQLLAAAQYHLLRDGGGLHCPHPAVQHLRVHPGPGPDQEDESQQAIREQPCFAEGLEDGCQSDRPAGPDVDHGLFLFRPTQSDSNLPVHHLQQSAG